MVKYVDENACKIDIFFRQISTFIKVWVEFVFGLNLSIKVSEAQKQRPCELLWMLWFNEKSISTITYYVHTRYIFSGYTLLAVNSVEQFEQP